MTERIVATYWIGSPLSLKQAALAAPRIAAIPVDCIRQAPPLGIHSSKRKHTSRSVPGVLLF